MSEEVEEVEEVSAPSTHEEVRKLVDLVPPPGRTQALLEAVKSDDEPRSVRIMKWLCLTMALFVVCIALVTVFQRNRDLSSDNEANAAAAECRSAVAGELLIAKAHGITAGNNYNALLGDALVGALEQRNTPEVLAELNKQLELARDQLRESLVEMDTAIDKQRNVAGLCNR